MSLADHVQDPPRAKPFAKYAGGKTRLLPQLLPLIPAEFKAYHEPFAGAGSVFFALSGDHSLRGGTGLEGAYLSDVNEDVIAAYRAIRDDLKLLIERLAEHERDHSPAHFAVVRGDDRDPAWAANQTPRLNNVERAARFLYLNRAGFNGLYRVNVQGFSNVPWGKRAKVEFDRDNLRECSKALQGAFVGKGDFARVMKRAAAGDLVYFDSPYEGTFDAYSAGKFADADHVRLAKVASALDDNGVSVVLSAADTLACRQRYVGWDVHEVEVRRSMSRDGATRGMAKELIIRSPRLAGQRREI